eukprot:11987723-Prorocentrum_lima.AAC.1
MWREVVIVFVYAPLGLFGCRWWWNSVLVLEVWDGNRGLPATPLTVPRGESPKWSAHPRSNSRGQDDLPAVLC